MRPVLPIATTLLAASISIASAQRVRPLVVPGGELDSYLRYLEVTGNSVTTMPLVFRSASTLRSLGVLAKDSSGPWNDRLRLSAPDSAEPIAWLEPQLDFAYNSATPHGVNDGALWAGRGMSGSVTGGLEFSFGPLRATVVPTLWFAQNDSFAILPVPFANRSPYAYPFSSGAIDWPQRFGNTSITKLDPGQSGLRLNVGPLTAGLSSENMWWGPSPLNPILMSSTAAGFPHVDVGLGRPVDIGIGHAEARLVYGRLAESAYFDTDTTSGTRLFVGITVGYAPSFLPGLTLGVTRSFYKLWTDTLTASDFVAPFQSVFKLSFGGVSDPTTNDDRDQLLSITARWVLPESGAEAWIEWARNDHSLNLRDYLLEPDHSRGYTFGFSKRLAAETGGFLLRGEVTQLGRSTTFLARDTPTFYVHYIVQQGYTQLGQLVGAGIGPGGESEYLGLDRYTGVGRVGVFVQRVVHNADEYYIDFVQTENRAGHDVEILGGVSAHRFFQNFSAGAALTVGRELNRYYIIDNDVTNLNLRLWASPTLR